MWRLPRDAAPVLQYVASPWKSSPSDHEIHKAFTAQYCSTYRWDFSGSPPGYDNMNQTGGRAANLRTRRQVSFPADTEMKATYRGRKQKPELQNSSSTGPTPLRPGIVPTVVQRHIQTQQKEPDLTTYERFCGKRVRNVSSVLKSLLPQELQQLHRMLPEEEKEAVKIILSKDPSDTENLEKLPAVASASRSPEYISTWPGPV
uniref:Uncharacterized protein n=2 Tax=Salarias fasciatus TaxID=181472 RepID=A0A672J9A7_SALFA